LLFDISIIKMIYNVMCSTVHLVWKTIKIFMKTDRNVILQLFSSCINNEQTNIKFLYLWTNRCVFSVLCLALAWLVYNSDINRYFIPPLDDSREYWTCCLLENITCAWKSIILWHYSNQYNPDAKQEMILSTALWY